MKTCSCGVEIDFVTTPAGKKIPVETGEEITIATSTGLVQRGLRVHWGRCKDEAAYRKERDHAEG